MNTAAPPTANDDLAIDLRDVAKTYRRGRVPALAGIEMHVRRGEIFGFLGPNGAGKSTLVKIMLTIVRPTRAAGNVLGRPIGHKPTLGRIGYLPENHRFPRYLTGRQVIEFFGALARVDRRTRKRRAAELIDLVGMGDGADRKVATYSKGMAQRIGLAQALVNDPELVLLDEPTDGVDPVGRRDIRDALLRLKSRGKTIFINSHLLSELEMITDRVAILVAGRVARHGTLAELTGTQQRYEIEVAGNGQLTRPLADVLAARVETITVPGPRGVFVPPPPGVAAASPPPSSAPRDRTIERGHLPTGRWIEIDGPVARVGIVDPVELQPLLDAMRAAKLIVQRVQVVRPTLEDLFIQAVNGGGGGGDGGAAR
jgi:ABC-2 type transport system ATP-binding protein